jgi:hypothetical protein
MHLLLRIVHPFPLSAEIFECEAKFFYAIMSVCDEIGSQAAWEIKASIINHYESLLYYDYATWCSSVVSDEIDELWSNYEGQGSRRRRKWRLDKSMPQTWLKRKSPSVPLLKICTNLLIT